VSWLGEAVKEGQWNNDAEKYYGISPYAYCGGDPVNLGDYDGMDTLYFIMNEDGKTARELYEEILSKNWATNKYGDNGYDQSKVSTVPAVGYLVNKINEKEKSDLKKKEKEDATNRYKIRFMLGE
jgi:hypothetical protein